MLKFPRGVVPDLRHVHEVKGAVDLVEAGVFPGVFCGQEIADVAGGIGKSLADLVENLLGVTVSVEGREVLLLGGELEKIDGLEVRHENFLPRGAGDGAVEKNELGAGLVAEAFQVVVGEGVAE